HDGVLGGGVELRPGGGPEDHPVAHQPEVHRQHDGQGPRRDRQPAEGGPREEAQALLTPEHLEAVAIDLHAPSIAPPWCARAGSKVTWCAPMVPPARPSRGPATYSSGYLVPMIRHPEGSSPRPGPLAGAAGDGSAGTVTGQVERERQKLPMEAAGRSTG